MRRVLGLAVMVALASCVAPQQTKAPAPRPAPPPPPAPPAPRPALGWQDVPLTPGRWVWHGGAGQSSISQYVTGTQTVVFALRCDLATRNILFTRAGILAAPAGTITFTTSFGAFSLTAGPGAGDPPAIVAQATARDPHMDQIAFSRGRFLVEMAGQTRLVLPAYPEVARVIEDCRI